jgi:hypothetical protein
LAAREEERPVVPAPPSRYYRPVPSGTTLAAREKARPVPLGGASTQARVEPPPKHEWSLHPRYRSRHFLHAGRKHKTGTTSGASTQGLAGASTRGTARGTARAPSTLDICSPI